MGKGLLWGFQYVVVYFKGEYIRAGHTIEEANEMLFKLGRGDFDKATRDVGITERKLTYYGWNRDYNDRLSILRSLCKYYFYELERDITVHDLFVNRRVLY